MSDWLRWFLIAVALLAAVVLLVGRRRHRLEFPQVRVRRGIAMSVLAWLFIAIVVAGGTAGGLLWFFGWPHLPTAAVFDVTQLLDLLKIALSVVAGFGGVVLLAVNYRKQRVTENEHALAVGKATRETVQGFNERLGTAAEQLAHESPAVRLTGVYALAGLADDWEDKRQVCVDVLCGYLRLQSETMTSGEVEVRRAILRMIRDRLSGDSGWRQPVDFDFTGVAFENADFSELYFPGRVTFDRADFSGALTEFDGSHFKGVFSCHGTRFAASRTTMKHAWFDAGVGFIGAEFTGRELDCFAWRVTRQVSFYRCVFRSERLNFSSLSIPGGKVRFEQAKIDDADLDFRMLSDDLSEEGAFSRLSFVDVRFVRCRLEIGLYANRQQMVRLVDCSLDTTVVVLEEFGVSRPWLNLRNVELRGGTDIPEEYVRRSAQQRLDH